MDKVIVILVLFIIICVLGATLSFNEILQEDKARTKFCISYEYLGWEPYSDKHSEYVCYKYVKDPSVDVGYLKIRSGVIPDEMIFQEGG